MCLKIQCRKFHSRSFQIFFFFFFLQCGIQSQITQRYRNNRRDSRKATNSKVTLPPSMVGTAPQVESDGDLEDDTMTYKENVNALSKLTEGKSPPAAQVVFDLLDATRPGRRKWLRENLSIHEDILDNYPCFRKSKWVSFFFSLFSPSTCT